MRQNLPSACCCFIISHTISGLKGHSLTVGGLSSSYSLCEFTPCVFRLGKDQREGSSFELEMRWLVCIFRPYIQNNGLSR